MCCRVERACDVSAAEWRYINLIIDQERCGIITFKSGPFLVMLDGDGNCVNGWA